MFQKRKGRDCWEEEEWFSVSHGSRQKNRIARNKIQIWLKLKLDRTISDSGLWSFNSAREGCHVPTKLDSRALVSILMYEKWKPPSMLCPHPPWTTIENEDREIIFIFGSSFILCKSDFNFCILDSVLCIFGFIFFVNLVSFCVNLVSFCEDLVSFFFGFDFVFFVNNNSWP